MSRELPYFRWYPADAESDASYAAMTLAELGLYHRALNHAWLNDGLPTDDERVRRELRVDREDFALNWPAVRDCFKGQSRLRNKRQEAERTHAKSKSKKASDAVRIRIERSSSDTSDDSRKKHRVDDPRALAPAESECVYESDSRSSKKNIPLNGKTSQRWEEFQDRYPYRIELDDAARQFVSVVSVDNEGAVFSCLDRYLASDQVLRGAVMKPANWLLTGHRDKWLSDWPKPQQKKHPKGLEDND